MSYCRFRKISIYYREKEAAANTRIRLLYRGGHKPAIRLGITGEVMVMQRIIERERAVAMARRYAQFMITYRFC